MAGRLTENSAKTEKKKGKRMNEIKYRVLVIQSELKFISYTFQLFEITDFI